MQIDAGAGSEVNKREVKFDNLYDVLFDSLGNAKAQSSLHKKLIISGERLDFLEQPSTNIHIVETSKAVVQVDKLKISKQFKLLNPTPLF